MSALALNFSTSVFLLMMYSSMNLSKPEDIKSIKKLTLSLVQRHLWCNVCVLTLSVVDLWFDLWSSTDTYGVMVCVLTLSVVDLWFDLWSSTKTLMV